MKRFLFFALAAVLALSSCKEDKEEVTHDGITWATRNVGELGTFVDRPENLGKRYTFEEAQMACPDGWRLPTAKEIHPGGTYTKARGVYGRWTGGGAVFLPAPEEHDMNDSVHRIGSGVGYWSSTPQRKWYPSTYQYLDIYENHVYAIHGDARLYVRCVKIGPGPNDEKGVLINGTTWATRNVAEPGTFTVLPGDYGYLYTIEQMRNVCPEGWDIPTYEDFDDLADAGSEWTIENSSNGRRFGSGDNAIFLPAVGRRYFFPLSTVTYEQDARGYYWSLEKPGTDLYFEDKWHAPGRPRRRNWYRYFSSRISLSDGDEDYDYDNHQGRSVRCVRR